MLLISYEVSKSKGPWLVRFLAGWVTQKWGARRYHEISLINVPWNLVTLVIEVTDFEYDIRKILLRPHGGRSASFVFRPSNIKGCASDRNDFACVREIAYTMIKFQIWPYNTYRGPKAIKLLINKIPWDFSALTYEIWWGHCPTCFLKTQTCPLGLGWFKVFGESWFMILFKSVPNHVLYTWLNYHYVLVVLSHFLSFMYWFYLAN